MRENPTPSGIERVASCNLAEDLPKGPKFETCHGCGMPFPAVQMRDHLCPECRGEEIARMPEWTGVWRQESTRI